jgi:beta-glucanase (GH16 family)
MTGTTNRGNSQGVPFNLSSYQISKYPKQDTIHNASEQVRESQIHDSTQYTGKKKGNEEKPHVSKSEKGTKSKSRLSDPWSSIYDEKTHFFSFKWFH